MWCRTSPIRKKDLPVWEREEREPRASDYLRKLQSHSLKVVADDLIERGTFRRAYLKKVVPEYRRFIALSVVSNQPISVGGDIDVFWHHHLLFTEDYRRMCDRVGCFVHHRPAILDRDIAKENTAKDCRDLYRDAFSEELPLDLWA